MVWMKLEANLGASIKYWDWSQGVHLTVKEKIGALKLLKECNDAMGYKFG